MGVGVVRPRCRPVVWLLASSVLVCLVLTVLSQTQLLSRSYMGLLLLLVAAAGLGELPGWVLRQPQANARVRVFLRLASAAAVVVATGVWLVFYQPQRFYFYGVMDDSPVVAAYLQQHVKPTDLVVTDELGGVNPVLTYQFAYQLQKPSLQMKGEGLKGADVAGYPRLFVFWRDAKPVTERLKALGAARAEFGPPRLIHRFVTTDLYQLDRIAPTN